MAKSKDTLDPTTEEQTESSLQLAAPEETLADELEKAEALDAVNSAASAITDSLALSQPQDIAATPVPVYQDTAASRSDIQVEGSVPNISPGTYSQPIIQGEELIDTGVTGVINSIPGPREAASRFVSGRPFLDEIPTEESKQPAMTSQPASSLATAVPVTSNVVTGTETTIPETAGYTQAKAGVDAAYQKETDNLTEKQNQLTQLMQIADPINQERAAAAQQHAARYQKLMDQGEAQYAQARSEADAIRQEMAQTPWTDFWGEKSTGDKILLSLAVGLGAYGQTQIGGKNVVLGVLEDRIKEHSTRQKQIHDNLRNRLTATSADAQTILDGSQKLINMEKGYAVAAYDQLDKELTNMQSRVKTAGGIATIETAKNELAIKRAEKLMEHEKDIRVKSSVTSDIVKSTSHLIPVGTPEFINTKGQRVAMAEADKVRLGRLMSMLGGEEKLSPLEKSGVTETADYAAVWNEFTNPVEKGLASQVQSIEGYLTRGGVAEGILAKNPRLRDYFQQLMSTADPEGRTQSGGVMNAGEMAMYLRSFSPAPQEGNSLAAHIVSRENAARKRRDEIETKRNLTQAPMKFSWEK